VHYHAAAATITRRGYRSHNGIVQRPTMLSNAEYIESRRARLGDSTACRASLQNNCANAIDIAKTRADLTKKANAVPIAMFACCIEIDDPKTLPVEAARPSR
jgi:hypothetical protein